MLRAAATLVTLISLSASPAMAEVAVSLRGSPASMVRQNEVAKQNDYSFLRTPAQVERFAEKGYLVRVEGNADFEVDGGVSFPFARPELLTFLERLSTQHRDACGERLVVTSLTRPTAKQPANSHALSVHPTGMAVDLRVSSNADCRAWLESTLLSLEEQDLLDVTRESRPPHFHVAVFPDAYRQHVARLTAEDSARAAATRAALAEVAPVADSFLPSSASAPPAEEPPTPAWWAGAALGLAFLAVGMRRRRGPKGDEAAGGI